jgi:hypothetical protein
MSSILLLLPLNTMNVCHNIFVTQWLLYVPIYRVSVPRVRRVADRLSRGKTGFSTGSVHMRICGGRSSFGTASSQGPSASSPSIILPTPHSHLSNPQQCCAPSANDSSLQQNNSALHYVTTGYPHVANHCHNQQSLRCHETLQSSFCFCFV